MKKSIGLLAFTIAIIMTLSSCGLSNQNNSALQTQPADNSVQKADTDNKDANNDNKDVNNDNSQTTQAAQSTVEQVETIDYATVKPDESGKIMIVMFHNFIETYTKGDKQYTTTFSDFEKLLNTLYEKKYRLVNLTDLLNNNIDIPAGCIPMVFTFDDGTAGEFNLIEENGQLKVNPKSAVGIMQEFNKKHPDFGMKGTFYVNLGISSTFSGAGTMQERLQYLIDLGFEIGNHTKSHISLPSVKTAEKIMEEVGGNQKIMEELVPGYKFTSFSLPFGGATKELKDYVIKGNYQGTDYENRAIMLVGANPAPSPASKDFKPLQLPRVRATGIEKVECDLDWWLKELEGGSSQYVSDGNANTITVPEAKKEKVDIERIKDKQVITY